MTANFIKRLLARIVRPILRKLLNDITVEDPWQRSPESISASKFGSGNTHEWAWYFEGRSDVQVSTVKELCRWLSKCKYAYDKALFNEADFWQHPLTFETTRKGDCEDHSLWTWRKLHELGYETEFVVGYYLDNKQQLKGRHAAVVFTRNGLRYFFDTVRKGGQQNMIFPIRNTLKMFCPQYSVDSHFNTYRYRGSLVIARETMNETDHHELHA
jgi:hypothetical protein